MIKGFVPSFNTFSSQNKDPFPKILSKSGRMLNRWKTSIVYTDQTQF